ncbi:uncharacterized protein LOC111319299, partial [Stylophora pistillata]|uniref:uncharacterized protein LOC111319299 n=1 Tax=Stylophora pistillata TaxID=50429 RepID=UPI000C03E704
TKIGKDSHLVLSRQNTSKPSFKNVKGSFSKDSEYLLFLDSLVSNVSMQVGGKDVKVLTCGSWEKSCKRSSRMYMHAIQVRFLSMDMNTPLILKLTTLS